MTPLQEQYLALLVPFGLKKNTSMRQAKIPRESGRWVYLHVPEKDPGSHYEETVKTLFVCLNLENKSWFSLFALGYIGRMDDAKAGL